MITFFGIFVFSVGILFSTWSLLNRRYVNTTISVPRADHTHVEMIFTIKEGRLKSANQFIASCIWAISLAHDNSSKEVDEYEVNPNVRLVIKLMRFITHPTMKPIPKRFQKTLQKPLSDRDTEDVKFSLVNSWLSIADMMAKFAFVHL